MKYIYNNKAIASKPHLFWKRPVSLHQEYNINSLLEYVSLFCSLFYQISLYTVFWSNLSLDKF